MVFTLLILVALFAYGLPDCSRSDATDGEAVQALRPDDLWLEVPTTSEDAASFRFRTDRRN